MTVIRAFNLSPSVTRLSDFSDNRDNNFNLIRMIAALGVLISHAYPLSLGKGSDEPLQLWLHGMSLGTLSVIIFFGISGFFISASFERSSSILRFIMARLLRIFPALCVVLIVTLIFCLFLSPPMGFGLIIETAEYFARNFTLYFLKYDFLHIFENNPYPSVINGSLWTLNHEFSCYILVLILGVMGFLKNKSMFKLTILIFFISYFVVSIFNFPVRIENLMFLGFPFFIGMILHMYKRQIKLSIFIIVSLIAASYFSYNSFIFKEIFIVTLVYAIFYSAYQIRGPIRSYNRLGDYSYGTYIYAFPIQQMVAYAGVNDPLVNIAFSVPLVLGCAVASWFLVEKPALVLLKKWKTSKALAHA